MSAGLGGLRVLVTRPRAQAGEAVERLRAEGIEAQALPLIDIEAPDDTAAVRAAWATLARHALVVFVSPNAVKGFFEAAPGPARWPARTRTAVVGQGSAQALREHGVPDDLIDAPAGGEQPQWDSEALWAQLRGRQWQAARVLIVRGDGGRDWLARRLSEAGAQVALLSVYRRIRPIWDAREWDLLREAVQHPAAHVWWFSSSQALSYLQQLLESRHLRMDWSSARAVATHPRIGQAAQQMGFGVVRVCSPAWPDLRRSIESLR